MPVIQHKFHPQYAMVDMDGHMLRLKVLPPGNIYKVTIQLKSETREREIAQVDVDHKCVTVVRHKEKHFFRADCGYGFNWTVINEKLPMDVDNVLLIEHDNGETDHYLIPIEDIRSRGHKQHFGRSGTELQWFMKMRDIMDYRIKDIQLLSPALVGKKS